jgi:hypothetical protein
MQDQLEQIDLGPLDELTTIKSELDTLDSRLQAMEERKGNVAEAVYLRVRSDYESRRQALEQQAAPLKAAAREQYARLFTLLSRFEADHQAIQLDREEVEFRHSLGEFADGEYKERMAAIDERLSSGSAAREKALSMRKRFVDAFQSEADLKPAESAPRAAAGDATTPVPRSAAADVADGSTQRLPTLDPSQAETRSIPLPAVDIGATQAMKVLKGGNDGPVRPDQTVMIRSARLVPQNNEAGKLTHMVGLRPVVLGSSEQCDVRVPGAAPQHAELKVGMSGYTVSDLGGGVRINGVVVEQHLLRHEDVIELGSASFVFRET